MDLETDEALAIAWITEMKRTDPEKGDLREQADLERELERNGSVASMRLFDIRMEDPDRALRIAIDISHRSDDSWVMCMLGCGPFEDALADMGRRAFDILKVEATENVNAWYALEHTWQNAMPDDVWQDLQRFLGRTGVG